MGTEDRTCGVSGVSLAVIAYLFDDLILIMTRSIALKFNAQASGALGVSIYHGSIVANRRYRHSPVKYGPFPDGRCMKDRRAEMPAHLLKIIHGSSDIFFWYIQIE